MIQKLIIFLVVAGSVIVAALLLAILVFKTDRALYVAIGIGAVLTLVGAFGSFFYVISHRSTEIESSNLQQVQAREPGETLELRAMAVFLSWRFLPKPLAYGHSNINPKITLDDNGVTYKFLRKKNRSYEEIEYVDIWSAYKTRNLYFYFHGKSVVFAANLATDENLQTALRYLVAKNVRLSNKAQEFLQ